MQSCSVFTLQCKMYTTAPWTRMRRASKMAAATAVQQLHVTARNCEHIAILDRNMSNAQHNHLLLAYQSIKYIGPYLGGSEQRDPSLSQQRFRSIASIADATPKVATTRSFVVSQQN